MAQLMTNAALDRIAERFGSNAITTADLTESSAAVDEDVS